MPRYAYFDHTQPAPQRVLGWFDTDAHAFTALPDRADLLILSDAQWDARLDDPSGWCVAEGGVLTRRVPPAPPAPTLAQQAQAAMYGTVTVTSEGVPEVAGTYAIDAQAQTQIAAIASGIAAGLGLPGGGESFNWPDTANAPHQWTADAWMQFAQGVLNYVYTCAQVAQGHGTALPSATIEITA
jgi:hypothetical protein